MALVLVYRGELLAENDSNKRTKLKQFIRRKLHNQLTEVIKKPYFTLAGGSDFFQSVKIGRFNFQALICKNPTFPRRGCDLEIRMLSRDPFNAVYQSGDLDNRLKIVFDALGLPNENQIEKDEPQEGEDPFWVLLSNDKLITDLHIVQDTLHSPDMSANYVELTITIKIKDDYKL